MFDHALSVFRMENAPKMGVSVSNDSIVENYKLFFAVVHNKYWHNGLDSQILKPKKHNLMTF